jgi:hypothetical protein
MPNFMSRYSPASARKVRRASGKTARNTLAGQVYRRKRLRNCTADLIKIYSAQEVGTISCKFGVASADGASRATRLSFHNKLGDNVLDCSRAMPRKEAGRMSDTPEQRARLRSTPICTQLAGSSRIVRTLILMRVRLDQGSPSRAARFYRIPGPVLFSGFAGLHS